jgi:hypothetical protein
MSFEQFVQKNWPAARMRSAGVLSLSRDVQIYDLGDGVAALLLEGAVYEAMSYEDAYRTALQWAQDKQNRAARLVELVGGARYAASEGRT